MHIDDAGLLLIERFEGYRSQRYEDSVGVLTIGYGTTSSVVDPVPATCTQVQAQGWLLEYIERGVEPSLNAAIAAIPRGYWTPNQNQYDALCSLAYNCGSGVFYPSWQIGRDLRDGNEAAVHADFSRYVYAGGQVLGGLVTRRAAEAQLFATPVPKPRPPKPPDPYAIYPKDRYSYKGISFTEYALAKTLDAALRHPRLRRGTLRALLPHAVAAKDRIEAVAARTGWTANRKERNRAWLARIARVKQALRLV